MASASAAPSPEARELTLVSKVELRIALADSETKLETILKTYLPPLLLKLASEHLSVRNKVISILQHVNARIAPPTIKLPLVALLAQFKDPSATPLLRHFDLLYLQQGITRVPPRERVELLPAVVHGIHGDAAKSVTDGAIIFNLVLRLLPHLSLPPRGSQDDAQLRATLGLLDRRDDASFLATYLGKTLLLVVQSIRTSDGNLSLPPTVPPGLTSEEYSFLTLGGKHETWDRSDPAGLNLMETKVAIAKLLSSGAFTDDERFLPALYASADVNSRVAELGDDMLKRSAPNVNIDTARVTALFDIYLGDSSTGRPAVKPALKTKILNLLSRSTIATTCVGQIVQVVEGGLIHASSEEGTTAAAAPSGREASKLRAAIFAFVNWVAKMGSLPDRQRLAPQLVYRLRDHVEGQGWPTMHAESASSTESSQRGLVYELIGLLASASPADLLLDPNLNLVRWLFTSLSAEPSAENISVSVSETLGGVLQAMAGALDQELQQSLRGLLLQHMSLEIGQESPAGDPYKVQRSTRFMAVRFATRCLPYHDVVARWICLLAVSGRSNERNEVVEEGRKGLDPYWYQILNPPSDTLASSSPTVNDPRYTLPDFAELVAFLFVAPPGNPTSDFHRPLQSERFQHHPSLFGPSVAYARRVFLAQSLRDVSVDVKVDADWERRLDAAVSSDEPARAALKSRLHSLVISGPERDRMAFQRLLQAAFDGLVANDGEGLDPCGQCLVELCGLSDDALTASLAYRANEVQRAVKSNTVKTRELAAQAFGILASHPSCPPEHVRTLAQAFTDQASRWKSAVGSEVYRTHGSILSLVYLVSRSAARGRPQPSSLVDVPAFISRVLIILAQSRDTLLQDAAILAVDQLSLFAVLMPSTLASASEGPNMVDHLVVKAKAGNERAVLALGRFAMTYTEDDVGLGQTLDHLYQLHELRQVEVHFTVGEALSCAATGWQMNSLLLQLDVEAPRPSSSTRTHTLSDVLEKILADCKQTKPSLRRASCIWLLCLIQYCGHLSDVQLRLRACQSAFKGFLSDRDELVQESASRGLTLIYEKGDRELKDDLVRDLVASFTGTQTQLSGHVDAETELFEPGALPTGDGSVSTYKDIMSLAAEVGDPSLVYRFMSMASSNAVWSSRAAFGRFGLGNILSESSTDGYLTQNPKLYPKLYRYRFDPNPKVQQSMNDIWSALVKDPIAALDRHFDAIMDDLLLSIIGREWRVRQASCAAIADLIQGRPAEKYQTYLGRIWTMAFKVLDDIKESVRAAAMALCRVLTSLLVRSVEAGSSSRSATAMLDNVMPFLMSPSGLEASATEVQAFALDTVLRLAKTGTRSLRPFVPGLVERLLGLLSTLEPEAVNYLHLNAAKYNLTEDKIDAARLKSVRSSPMMDAIERCLDLLDEEAMAALVPRLDQAMRSAVGMPSKVGCSRVLVSLSTRHNQLFRRHAGLILKTVQRTVRDRNDAVSSSYASAAGYLTRLVPDAQVLEVERFAQAMYFDADGGREGVFTQERYLTIGSATDRFLAAATAFLPFVFIAKHDQDEQVQERFAQTWDEHVGGTRAVLLYLGEIVGLAASHLDSARWVVKHTAALGIADAADVASQGQTLSLSQQKLLWPALARALNEKTWAGKERVLEAYVNFAQHSRQLQQQRPEVTAQIKKDLLRESRRQNAAYRGPAMLNLGKFAATYDQDDWSLVILDRVGELVQELSPDGDGMEIAEADDAYAKADAGAGRRMGGGVTGRSGATASSSGSTSSRASTLASAILAAFLSIHPTTLSGPDLSIRLAQLGELAGRAGRSNATSVQLAICEGLTTLGRELHSTITRQRGTDDVPLAGEQPLRALVDMLPAAEGGGSTERVKRAESAEVLTDLGLSLGLSLRPGVAPVSAEPSADSSEDASGSSHAWAQLQAHLLTAKRTERDPAVLLVLDRALGKMH
ncbi:MAG: proteasome component M29 [Thelocarpon superellum]|nr:MAG: proteasome component M29 [Thelocarpon superellum]